MNLWHGLSPTNLVSFERLEPNPRRLIRQKLQDELFKQVDPDIALFQEVNPITTRFHQLCKDLGRHGQFQPDLVGPPLEGVIV